MFVNKRKMRNKKKGISFCNKFPVYFILKITVFQGLN